MCSCSSPELTASWSQTSLFHLMLYVAVPAASTQSWLHLNLFSPFQTLVMQKRCLQMPPWQQRRHRALSARHPLATQGPCPRLSQPPPHPGPQLVPASRYPATRPPAGPWGASPPGLCPPLVSTHVACKEFWDVGSLAQGYAGKGAWVQLECKGLWNRQCVGEVGAVCGDVGWPQGIVGKRGVRMWGAGHCG